MLRSSGSFGLIAVVALLALATPAVAAPGQLDTTFGTAGRAIVSFPRAARPSDLLVEDDGAVVATGSVDGFDGLVVARFLSDGSLDPGFGVGGVARVDVPSSGAVALARDAHGRVLVAGQRSGAAGYALVVARLRADGSPDPAFGSGGVVVGAPGIAPAIPSAMQIDAHDRILVAGLDTYDGSRPAIVSRLLADGSPDPAF